MPLGGGVLVDRARIFDLIDRLRVAGPSALGGTVVAAGDGEEVEAVRRSETEARAQLARAEEEVTRLRKELDHRIGDQEVTRIAEERGRAMLVEADQKAQQTLREAEEQAAERLAQAASVAAQQLEEVDSYALQLLQRLDEQIALFLENIRSGAAQLEGKRGPGPTIERYSHEPMVAPEADLDDEAEVEEEGDEDGEDETPKEGTAHRFPWRDDD